MLTSSALTLASHSLSLLAQATTTTTSTAASQPAVQPPWYMNPMIMPIALGVFLLFFMSRSKKTQEKQHEQLLSNLKKNDRIQTIGGILGTVIEVREGRVQVKVDETSNTKIWFSRKAIHRVLGEDGAETK